ncbi:MAG: prephenate dehydrogenase/arogenate dehydrogenase family protein [Candidatus Roizmanbacteria bacterium]|nr:prephenate dehydrogenase/arogenate dehydrogenase family protein [Candidatus Roizmanbacteria bacterium]
MTKQKTITIVGFGRFGQTLCRLLDGECQIRILTAHPKNIKPEQLPGNCRIVKDVREGFMSDVIFYCVPIRDFEKVLKSHKQLLTNQLLIDVLSVKLHAQRVFAQVLKGTSARALLTHPMFGPDSSKEGFAHLRIVMDQFTATKDEYQFWKAIFIKKGLTIIEMNADTHDRLAARSQGVAHLMGRTLAQFGMQETPIDTKGSKLLLELMEQTVHDSWELFEDMQTKNPYAKKMRTDMYKAVQAVFSYFKFDPGG